VLEKKKGFVIVGIIVIAIMGISIMLTKPTTDQSLGNEKILMHIHPRLYLNIDGKPYFVSQNVGIDADLWKDHSLDQYGINRISPLHTHTADGMIHVESSAIRNYTLGEFLDIWGLDLKVKSINVSVYGVPISDYRNHVFKDDESIIMNIKSNP